MFSLSLRTHTHSCSYSHIQGSLPSSSSSSKTGFAPDFSAAAPLNPRSRSSSSSRSSTGSCCLLLTPQQHPNYGFPLINALGAAPPHLSPSSSSMNHARSGDALARQRLQLLPKFSPFPATLQSLPISTNSHSRAQTTMADADADADGHPQASPTIGITDDPFQDSEYVSDDELPHQDPAFSHVDRWDVLGLGQAMVDFSGVVDDEFLERLDLEKGTRKLVHHEERGKVLRAMDGCSYKAAAGGSLSNSLVALARLGSQPVGGPVMNVAMAGSVGSDPLGGFYRAKLRRAGVNFLSAPVKDGTTGTVIVLTTPDAQRTMLAYQGTSSTVNYDSGLSSIISKTNILVVEGYLFELPDTIETITQACKDAHSSGALVAVTASDVSCIERHYDNFWEIIGNYADIVFANSDEARALCNFSLKESPISATRYLSHFVPLVSVTDGPRGSFVGVRGEAVYIPPSPCEPVDTCGAGDAYASGILYGILRGVSDLKDMGTLAARVAAIVVGQQGTRLRVQDAVELAETFAFHLENSAI